jgi:excisionase family DNA binding protein
MAKMFYTAKEAAQKLGVMVDALQDLVRSGKLREFRDGSAIHYKVEDVDRLAGGGGGRSPAREVLLEPVEDSGVVLAPTGSDVLSLEEIESEDPSAATKSGKDAEQKKKEGTVVSSVGVSVFDDDELGEVVDPLAQTAVSESPAIDLEGVGSGSGILDLTRESDDTSLGAELLDEIYSAEDEGTVELGEATRAGLDEAIPEPATAGGAEVFEPVPERAVAAPGVRRVTAVEYAPDALSSGLTATMTVAILVMCVAGLAVAGLVRGVEPALLGSIYHNLAYFSGGALLLAALTALIGYFVGRRAG